MILPRNYHNPTSVYKSTPAFLYQFWLFSLEYKSLHIDHVPLALIKQLSFPAGDHTAVSVYAKELSFLSWNIFLTFQLCTHSFQT